MLNLALTITLTLLTRPVSDSA